MAEFDALRQQTEHKSKLKETYHRLTAPVHVTLNSYKEHERIEGYYEFKDYAHLFKCDRLLKLETAFGKVQMGYNPNRRRSFVFANMKANIYDTVNSTYQKTMKEYQRQSVQRKENVTYAYVSKSAKNAAVMLEKVEYRPWTENVLEAYFHKKNMETVMKTMPFFYQEQEKGQIEENREKRKKLQEQIRENALKGNCEENQQINREIRELQETDNLLQAILYRKDANKRGFVRKLNYAFDIEKSEMFDYYRTQRLHAAKEEVEAISVNDDGSAPEENNEGN